CCGSVRVLSRCGTATTELYTLSLHDALPILFNLGLKNDGAYTGRNPAADIADLIEGGIFTHFGEGDLGQHGVIGKGRAAHIVERSEEHTSELQSRENLVCRLLLEKKKTHC